MKRLTLVCLIVLVLSGCLAKKKVAEAIDAASPPDPVAASVDADAGVVALAEPDADLAPLAVAKTPAAAVKPRKPAAPVANPDAPNCANARLYCNHPQVGTNPKIKDQCTGFTTECLRAGGKV